MGPSTTVTNHLQAQNVLDALDYTTLYITDWGNDEMDSRYAVSPGADMVRVWIRREPEICTCEPADYGDDDYDGGDDYCEICRGYPNGDPFPEFSRFIVEVYPISFAVAYARAVALGIKNPAGIDIVEMLDDSMEPTDTYEAESAKTLRELLKGFT